MPHAHDVQPLVERLAALGLGREEAALYVHLMMHGPSKAGDVAAALGHPRPKAYRLLNGLMHRGFVAAALTRPTVFEAAPPERLFAGLFAAIQVRAQALEAARTDLSPQLATLRGARTDQPMRVTYKILQGRAETAGLAEAMVREAREGIVLLDATAGAGLAAARGLAFERGAAGVPVQALVAGPFPRLKLEAWTRASALRLRETPATGARLVLADGRSLLWLAHDASGDPEGPRDAALWTDAPDLADALGSLFAAAWERGKPPSPDVTDHDLAALGLGLGEPTGTVRLS